MPLHSPANARPKFRTTARHTSSASLLEATNFARNFLANKACDHNTATTRLLNRLIDAQMQCSLFKNCTRSTIPHLLASDVHCNLDTTSPPTLSKWTLPFNANHHFLSHALNAPHPLPPHMPSLLHPTLCGTTTLATETLQPVQLHPQSCPCPGPGTAQTLASCWAENEC